MSIASAREREGENLVKTSEKLKLIVNEKEQCNWLNGTTTHKMKQNKAARIFS